MYDVVPTEHLEQRKIMGVPKAEAAEKCELEIEPQVLVQTSSPQSK